MLAIGLAACTEPSAPHNRVPPATPTPTSSEPVPVEVVSFAFDEVTRFHRIDARVELSAPASVAIACVRRDDPAEAHLLESPAARDHLLTIGGLHGDTDYDCTVAAIDPPGPPATASARTLAPPSGQATVSVERSDGLEPTGAYTLVNVQRDCIGGDDMAQYLVMYDLDGDPRWRMDLPDGLNFGLEARYDGGGEIVWGGGAGYGLGAPTVLDVFGGQQWTLAFPGSDAVLFHHDGKRIADGRLLTTELTFDHGWMDFQLRVSAEDGATDWFFDSDEGVDAGWLLPGDADTNPDPYHLNWADQVDTDRGPEVVASLCTGYQVFGLDPDTHAPRWRLAVDGDLSPQTPAGTPLPTSELPQCTHGLEFDGEHLLVYDNGHQRGFSRAAEWTLDPDAGTATRDWTWTEPGWFETSLGDVDWLDPAHERVLITEAHGECVSPSPGRPHQVLEIDVPTGEVVHRITFDDPLDSGYRSDRIGGCDVFGNTRLCPALAERLDALRGPLGL